MIAVFLEVADGAYSILTGKDGLLYPSAHGNARGEEAPQETAARLVKESIGVVAPPQKFRALTPNIFAATYSMTMGPFILSANYTDDDSYDRAELEAMPERLSPVLQRALSFL